MQRTIYCCLSLLFFLLSCQHTTETVSNDTSFVRGADISWLPQMEQSGYTFYNDRGVSGRLFQDTQRPRDQRHSIACMGKPVG